MNKIDIGIYKNKGEHLFEWLQTHGKRHVTLIEAQEYLNLSKKNVLAILGLLVKKQKLISPTRGFYAILPPAERKHGFNPLPILDQMMQFRESDYYVGLLSASNHFGVAHQKPQVLQILVPKQLKFRKAQNLGLSFHTKKGFSNNGLIKVKTVSGYVNFSSPELTALDLFSFEKAAGGIENILVIMKSLKTLLKSNRLKQIVADYPFKSSVQKLGFVLDYFQASPSLLRVISQWLNDKKLARVGLSSCLPKKGSLNKKWSVYENINMELIDDF